MRRRLGAIACLALVWSLAGCGGGDADQTSEKDVRACLADAQFALQQTGGASSQLSGLAPVYAADFSATTKNGVSVDIIVLRSEGRARQTATHVRSALASLGASGATVVTAGNVVAVFAGIPSQADRDAVRSCLAA